MKKTILILLIFALFTAPALATRGACSGHDGVNCAAGSDYDGSVICYDGWKNSSVSYSAMVMCSSYSVPSTTPTTKTIVPIAPIVPVAPVVVPVAPVIPVVPRPVAPEPVPDEISVNVKEEKIEQESEIIISQVTPAEKDVEADSDSSAAGVVIGLGALAGAGYVFKKYGKK